MISVEKPQELASLVGSEVGVTDWLAIDQKMIDDFGRVTGDHQWIHMDVERARREMPGGKTIAHGYLILSLTATLLNSLYEVRSKKRGINYGLDKVRFLAPVPEGARIRLRSVLKAAEPLSGNGYRFQFANTFELEGSERPAAITENIVAVYV